MSRPNMGQQFYNKCLNMMVSWWIYLWKTLLPVKAILRGGCPHLCHKCSLGKHHTSTAVSLERVPEMHMVKQTCGFLCYINFTLKENKLFSSSSFSYSSEGFTGWNFFQPWFNFYLKLLIFFSANETSALIFFKMNIMQKNIFFKFK